MVEQLPNSSGNVIGFKLSGKLSQADYEIFVPRVEKVIEKHGKARFLTWFQDFEGWELAALWEDIKFASCHVLDIERIALIGEESWQEWMATICSPFTMAEVEYFQVENLDDAWNWIASEEEK